MIFDTNYFLPLARIRIDNDVLRAVAENKADLDIDQIGLSLISIFELQAKASKLRIPSKAVNESIRSIVENFTIIPFSDSKVVELSFELKREISDYVDCIIVATAASLREDLLTEDLRIWAKRKMIFENYGVKVSRYRDVLLSIGH